MTTALDELARLKRQGAQILEAIYNNPDFPLDWWGVFGERVAPYLDDTADMMFGPTEHPFAQLQFTTRARELEVSVHVLTLIYKTSSQLLLPEEFVWEFRLGLLELVDYSEIEENAITALAIQNAMLASEAAIDTEFTPQADGLATLSIHGPNTALSFTLARVMDDRNPIPSVYRAKPSVENLAGASLASGLLTQWERSIAVREKIFDTQLDFLEFMLHLPKPAA